MALGSQVGADTCRARLQTGGSQRSQCLLHPHSLQRRRRVRTRRSILGSVYPMKYGHLRENAERLAWCTELKCLWFRAWKFFWPITLWSAWISISKAPEKEYFDKDSRKDRDYNCLSSWRSPKMYPEWTKRKVCQYDLIALHSAANKQWN